jgi:hypothetical protein
MRYEVYETNAHGARLADAIAPDPCEAAQHVARRYGRNCSAVRVTGSPGMSGIWAVYRYAGDLSIAHVGEQFYLTDWY